MRSNFEQEMQLLDRALQRKVDATSDARDDFRREYFQLRSFEKLLVHDLLKEKEASEKVSVLNSAHTVPSPLLKWRLFLECSQLRRLCLCLFRLVSLLC